MAALTVRHGGVPTMGKYLYPNRLVIGRAFDLKVQSIR
jgi:hypothetical protein